jgi:hypothetical protein
MFNDNKMPPYNKQDKPTIIQIYIDILEVEFERCKLIEYISKTEIL